MTSAADRPILSETGPAIEPPNSPPIGPMACRTNKRYQDNLLCRTRYLLRNVSGYYCSKTTTPITTPITKIINNNTIAFL